MDSDKSDCSQGSQTECTQKLGTRFSSARDTILEIASVKKTSGELDWCNNFSYPNERGKVSGEKKGMFFNGSIGNSAYLSPDVIKRRRYSLEGNIIFKDGKEGAIKISPLGTNYGDSYYEAYWLQWLKGDLILEQVMIDNQVYSRDEILDLPINAEDRKTDYYGNRDIHLPNVFRSIPLRQKKRLTA